MAASKLLLGLMLVLAVSGAMAQGLTTQEKAIVASCGVPVALKLKPQAPKCGAEIAKAKKACPTSCKAILKLVGKNAKCGGAVLKGVPKTSQAKIKALCMAAPTGRRMI